METKEIVEALLYKMPNIRKAFNCLNILSLERKYSSVERLEFKNILSNFENPKIISVISSIQVTLIIEPVPHNRKYSLLMINGYTCEYLKLSKTGIYRYLLGIMNIRDFIPPSFINKIIYIKDFNEKVEGVVFSEFSRNKWTLDDPLLINIDNYNECGAGIILDNILSDLF